MTDITMDQALNKAKKELNEHDERMVVDHLKSKQREIDKIEVLLKKMKEEMEETIKQPVSELAMELAMKNQYQGRAILSGEIMSIED